MEVILADDYGFCYGVKRAIKTAKDNIDLSKKVCTLGPIIHNPQMVKSLADEGIGIVESVDEMENGKIIIRSHGVRSEERRVGKECLRLCRSRWSPYH